MLGVGAPALAGALWAVEHGAESCGAGESRPRRSGRGWPRSSRCLLATGRTSGSRAPDLAERLASRRIFVAPGSAWGDEHHVRITLRDAAATDRLVAALRDV